MHGSVLRRRDPGQWYLLFQGIAAGNGYGDPIGASRAGRITQASRPALCFSQVQMAGFYDEAGLCQDSTLHIAASTGTCPSLGYG